MSFSLVREEIQIGRKRKFFDLKCRFCSHFNAASQMLTEEGCTILKTAKRAGFVCTSTDLMEMNDNLEFILNKVIEMWQDFIELCISFFFTKRKFRWPQINACDTIEENSPLIEINIK